METVGKGRQKVLFSRAKYWVKVLHLLDVLDMFHSNEAYLISRMSFNAD